MIARLLGLFRTPAETLRTGGRPRSPEWPIVRRVHLVMEPVCQACGQKDALEVHHIQPIHLAPGLELEPANLITLCDSNSRRCHFIFGHLGSWSAANPHVREDAALHLSRVRAYRR